MHHFIIYILINFLIIGTPFASSFSDEDFSTIDKVELSELLFSEIERLDAAGIRSRNTYKKVSWEEYKKYISTNILKSKNSKDLAKAFDELQQGFVNQHSFFQLYNHIYDSRFLYENTSDIKGLSIGYTFPDVKFFLSKSGSYIDTINGISILERFERFEQYECSYTYKEACLNKFVKRVGWGLQNFKIKKDNDFSLNKKHWVETLSNNKQLDSVKINESFCESYANFNPSFTLIYSSHKTCLLKAHDVFIIKLSEFKNWGTEQDNIFCNGSVDPEGMCDDINNIRERLKNENEIKLVIDLQGNKGGTENTPFLLLLAKNYIYDNLVKFKNTEEIKSKSFRESVFYQLKPGIEWYKKLEKDSKSSEYLPARPDFCRGDIEQCVYKPIIPTTPNLDIKNIVLVTNSSCVSSCDDFVWRLKKYSSAYVIGQPPASDSTYSTVTGIIYLTENKKLKVLVKGPNQNYNLGKNVTKLAWFTVPYTATVSLEGNYIDGDTSILDDLNPITINNYKNLTIDNITKAVEYIDSL